MIGDLISKATWVSLGWAMIHFMWVGVVIGIVFLDVERLFLRRASSNVRYTHGLFCLVSLAIAAGWCVWHEWPAPVAPEHEVPVAFNETASSAESVPMASASVLFLVEVLDEPEAGKDIEPEPVANRFQWVAILPWFWFAGAGLFGSFLVFGLAGTSRLRRSAKISNCSDLQRRCDQLRLRLGVANRVGVAISDRVKAPLLVGFVRPLIVLPTSALSGMSPSMVEWILLHELAHVRRLDNVAIIFQRVIECLLFFHPCVWIASRWVDREREFCCDEIALAGNAEGDPSDYARTLAALVGLPVAPLAPASAMASHALVERIRRLVDGGRRSRSGGGGAVVGLTVGTAILSALIWWSETANSMPAEPALAAVESETELAQPTAEELVPIENLPAEVAAEDLLVPLPPAAPTAVDPEAPEPAPQAESPAAAPADGEVVARSYRVPPNFLSLIPGDGSLERRFEANGFPFPENTFALFDPSRSVLVLKNDAATVRRIERWVEPRVSLPGPQVYLTSKIALDRGGMVKHLTVPSVVTRSGQRAKIEIIRELIYPIDPKAKPVEYEMTPIGLEIEFDAVASKESIDIEVSGNVQIRLPKGMLIDRYLDAPHRLNPSETHDERPEFDLYLQPFKRVVKSGKSFELELGEVAGVRALLKRNRLEPGTLKATLTAQLLDASGQPLDSLKSLRAAYPPFLLTPFMPPPVVRADGARLFANSLAAFDLGEFVRAEASARSALAAQPGNAEFLAQWRNAIASKKNQKRGSFKPGAWYDRSYRLHPPLMPEECSTDDEALARFLKRCGLGMPAGATARVDADGFTLRLHNLGQELEKLERAVAESLYIHRGGVVLVDVEVVKGAGSLDEMFKPQAEQGVLVPRGGAPGMCGIAGVLTDEQYRVIRSTAEEEGAIKTIPQRRLRHEKRIEALEGEPLKGWSCELEAVVSADGKTIEGTFAPEQFEADAQGKRIFSTRKLSTSVTVWDGQWVALAITNAEGGNDLVFVRLQVAKL